jgi:hypothetical protein
MTVFGISLVWRSPLYSSSHDSGSLNVPLVGYSHSLGIFGEYLSAEIPLVLRKTDAEGWVQTGLGRDITIYNPGGTRIFRGFVNRISARIGGISFELGPMTDIANRVMATYTARVILDDFITDAGQAETTLVEDTESQDLYGIWERVIQAGTCLVDPATGYNEAEDARDIYLAQFRYPQSVFTVTPNTQETGAVVLTVEGYQNWLGAYIYQPREIGTGGAAVTQTVTQKIIDALGDNPNTAILNTSMFRVGANAALKVDRENQYRTALEVIEDVVKIGDGVSPWRFYVNEDREAVYELVDLQIAYVYHLSENKQAVYDYLTRSLVAPWDVKPGRVIFLADWLIGEYGYPGAPGIDPRVALINEVRYTAPYGLDISSVPLNRFENYLNMKAGGQY